MVFTETVATASAVVAVSVTLCGSNAGPTA